MPRLTPDSPVQEPGEDGVSPSQDGISGTASQKSPDHKFPREGTPYPSLGEY